MPVCSASRICTKIGAEIEYIFTAMVVSLKPGPHPVAGRFDVRCLQRQMGLFDQLFLPLPKLLLPAANLLVVALLLAIMQVWQQPPLADRSDRQCQAGHRNRRVRPQAS